MSSPVPNCPSGPALERVQRSDPVAPEIARLGEIGPERAVGQDELEAPSLQLLHGQLGASRPRGYQADSQDDEEGHDRRARDYESADIATGDARRHIVIPRIP